MKSRLITAGPWSAAWLPLLSSPFLYGIVIKVFPIDRDVALIAALVLLAVAALAGIGAGPDRPGVALLIGLCAAVSILSMPFLLPWATAQKDAPSNSPTAVYSFKQARANPQAFAKWWNFFVAEVLRVQPILFEREDANAPLVPRPGAQTSFYRGHVALNNKGYRGDDFPDKKGDAYRIVTIGNSATFGQSLFPDSRPWSSVLQKLISSNLTCARPIHVINGGVNAHHVRHAVDRIERDFAWLQPDMVLSYFGWNSSADLGFEPQIAPLPALPALDASKASRTWWYAHRAAVLTANGIVSSVYRLVADFYDDTEGLVAQARRGKLFTDMQQLAQQSERLGYLLVFLGFNTAVEPTSPDEAIRFYTRPWTDVRAITRRIQIQNALFAGLARERGIAFVDTSDGLRGRYDEDLFIDVVHFTTRGDAVMAGNVYTGILPQLLRDKSLGCRPRPRRPGASTAAQD